MLIPLGRHVSDTYSLHLALHIRHCSMSFQQVCCVTEIRSKLHNLTHQYQGYIK
uniref:Uncharacterized protein n=1 Tax=Arundo donax TaxID=35708 RepID=A0A0A9DV97_ARUDO